MAAQKRNLRPRETSKLAVAPVTATDLTCALVFGLEARPFCEFLIAADVPHAKIGRLADVNGVVGIGLSKRFSSCSKTSCGTLPVTSCTRPLAESSRH